MACVNAIVVSLEGEAAEWVTGFLDEGPPELGDPDIFLESSEPDLKMPRKMKYVG